ncbi:hypothetical protein D9756_005938 [Leucocoprinus leucothites]|uniref:Alcohol acetyltransferase n=1 Tax=Leucocoprinus leucothites TaxID=201217 RepID=A0A8H5FXT6_9AGAR|nr:hypothetical protein D9756_005938 [Leucoagaricus leucothites]
MDNSPSSSPCLLSYLPDIAFNTLPREQVAGIETMVNALDLNNVDGTQSERTLGDTEASYYLPSRESGVNDMYLHLGFNACPKLVAHSRMSLIWSILRVRHPLLAARVEMNAYADIRFVCDHPRSPEDILQSAQKNLEFRSQTKDELIDSYLNGERTLSNKRLSYLILSSRPTPAPQNGTESESPEQNFDLLICAAHWIGDGMALHTFANEFFGLLGSCLDEAELRVLLEQEFKRLHLDSAKSPLLPNSVEDQLPLLPQSKFFKAASKIDFKLNQRKLLGGHSLPRKSGQPRRTIVPTASFDPARTKTILQSCKANGVSISSALFAICSIAWARTRKQNWELPVMMYTALNLRPNIRAEKALSNSYWFIAISYFNVVLPAFLPQSGDISSTFWHRARSAKKQCADVAKHPLIVSRSIEMARERGTRARTWAKEDDDKAAGVVSPTPPPPSPSVENTPVPESLVPPSKAPSTALIGLSLLGNLDGIYKHAEFPRIKLHTLTTGSRQRSGGMLLFGYTFVGKLWVSLGYDENGFDKEVINQYWSNVLSAIDDLL